MASHGPYGPAILFSDGTTEPVPADDVEPPPLTGDITFELNRRGFEVWFSVRIVREHQDLIEDFQDWLLGQPDVVSGDDDTLGAVFVLGVLDEALRTGVIAWWASRIEGLEFGG